jgi:SAM-dependent methyltransferase
VPGGGGVTITERTGADERQRVLDAYARRGDDAKYDASRPDQLALAAARSEVWRARLARRGRGPGAVVEIGCGTGAVARWAVHQGASSVVGVDVQVERLRAARTRLPLPGYAVGDARSLPLPDASVDVAICSTLFSSVLDEDIALAVAHEIDRVLAADGTVLWFDFFRRNPRNPDVRPVRREELARWFPGWDADLRRVVLAPPIARRLTRVQPVAGLLAKLPFLRTHYAGSLTRRTPAA